MYPRRMRLGYTGNNRPKRLLRTASMRPRLFIPRIHFFIGIDCLCAAVHRAGVGRNVWPAAGGREFADDPRAKGNPAFWASTKPIMPSASAPSTINAASSLSIATNISRPAPMIAQGAIASACMVLSTMTEALASMPFLPHNSNNLALTISPPMVATGNRLLIVRPIHRASINSLQGGVRSRGNNKRQDKTAAMETGSQVSGSNSSQTPESSKSRNTPPAPCHAISKASASSRHEK